jgi:cytochrome P450
VQLAQRPELRERPENLIQSLVGTRDAGDELTDAELAGNVLTLLLAGEDTTAHTLAWMLWLMAGAPAEMDRARAEVQRVVGNRRVPTRLEELSALDFVDACANEAMRMKPVAPLNIVEAAEDVEVAGVAVPRGTFVVCVMRAAGLDEAHFPEPGSFRPDRWLQSGAADDTGTGRMFSAKRTVMPFGAGPRVCPGRYLALAEIKMAIGMMLSNFEITRVWSEDGEPRECLKLTMAPVGLRMKLRPL